MRTRYKLVLLGPLVLAVPALPGCESNMDDPWVSGPDVLKQERMRDADLQKELRERLAQVQTDR